MSRIAYVNGRYVPQREAAVRVEDRGYQFADGVYEVIAVQEGRFVDEEAHLERLNYSLSELRIAWPIRPRSMRLIMREVVRRNRIDSRGVLYLQVTRGVAPRSHAFPASARSSLVMTARPLPALDRDAAREGVSVITLPDCRWQRRDIKSISLLPNVLGKQQAVEAGAYEAWLVAPDGTVTEGTSSNAWIVSAAGAVITRQSGHAILNGVTRRALIDIAGDLRLVVVERPFSVNEAKTAREAFLTSTTSLVKPVVRIDNTIIGNGTIGPLTDRLLSHCMRRIGLEGMERR